MNIKGKPTGTYRGHYLSHLHDECEEGLAAKEAFAAHYGKYTLPAGMTVEDRTIDGQSGGADKVLIRIFRPQSETPPPMILDIHGGGWTAGTVDNDNFRCTEIAKRVPAIVVSLNYTLSDGREHHFPAPLIDCRCAYMWLYEHGKEIGGDPTRLGLHGSSAGGNIAGGLALWLRDHNGPRCSLAVLNCPCLYPDFRETSAYHQNYELRLGSDEYAESAEVAYLGGTDGGTPSYYAFPGLCPDLHGLCPHYLIAAEYDTLRDDSVRYVQRLLTTGVQTDFQLAARACHCFSGVEQHPYTDLTHDMIAYAFRREFGME